MYRILLLGMGGIAQWAIPAFAHCCPGKSIVVLLIRASRVVPMSGLMVVVGVLAAAFHH
jgi:hypothetical protein